MKNDLINSLLVGKIAMVMTDMKVKVPLTIAEVIEEHHSQQIGESNRANDWYPETRDWKTIKVIFDNKAFKIYNSINEIEIFDI